MSSTYTNHANVCAKFYSLTLDPEETADFILKNSRAVKGQSALFVGGMFDIASALISRGLHITLVDYTDEMVEIAKSKFGETSVFKSDLRELPFDNQFDIVFVIGRVFTHMISNEDLDKAIFSCKRSLKSGGQIFADNYEDSRIQVTKYFNGRIDCSDSTCRIIRDSTTTRKSDSPRIVQWDAHYSGHMNGTEFNFKDSIDHRAFSREEFRKALEKYGFSVEEQGDNFDETSFYTLGRKIYIASDIKSSYHT